MTALIGIIAAREEPAGYRLLRELLEAEGQLSRSLDGELGSPALAEFQALLIDDTSRVPFEPLSDWVTAGGNLLLFGGDNLGGLSLASSLSQKSIYNVRLASSGRGLTDISASVGRTAALAADYGFTFTPPGQFTHSVKVYGGTYLFVRMQIGAGAVCLVGSSRLFQDRELANEDNLTLFHWLLPVWLPWLTAAEARRRMRRPQRHRLLHGYPMAPLMRGVESAESAQSMAREFDEIFTSRPLIAGVLPHPFCNPSVRGCGFCTFPHESFSRNGSEAVVEQVVGEITAFRRRHCAGRARDLEALYFGGGTANLTPPGSFQRLCRALGETFDLQAAEITLEGVPIYFIAQRPSLLEILRDELPARQYRVSMGIQTFDAQRLKLMGRAAFGNRETFAEVASLCRQLGYRVSADLLYNLPGQTFAEMLDDIDKAVELGLDQICIYHLVMFEGLGTEWSQDRGLLAGLPDNAAACDNWLKLRETLIGRGFAQTSLTNFEQVERAAGEQRFCYEEYGYQPERYNLLGFGPSGISLICAEGMERAVKLVNPEGAGPYAEMVSTGGQGRRSYHYDRRDMKILYLTRKIARLGLSRADYRAIFAADAVEDFASEFETLAVEGLVKISDEEIALTPHGMFYADTVAGLLAWRQVQLLQLRGLAETHRQADLARELDDSLFDPMG